MILIGRGLDLKRPRKRLVSKMVEVWMCGFQGTREIKKEARDVRRLPKKRQRRI